MNNIKYVLGEGVDDPYFGKMLYLWMADGYDRAKIDVTKYVERLLPFRDD